MRGKFITLEGVDGAGKSSHVEWLAARLRQLGKDVEVTREPGGTPLGEELRKIVLSQPMDLETETLILFAARREHLAKRILPALEAGRWVLSDRFTDATFAYQGGGRGVALDRIEQLEAWVQCGLQPDLTLFFDLSPEIARSRLLAGQNQLDRFEREDLDFFIRVRGAYIDRAAEYPDRFRVIDANQDLQKVKVQLDNIVTIYCS
jgi:dTMP kinase